MSRGFTLLETLCSLALCAWLAVGAVSWIGASQRALRSAVVEPAASRCADRALAALLEDIRQGWPGTVDVDADAGLVRVRTGRWLPGDRPGWSDVAWAARPNSGELVRTCAPLDGSAPGERVIYEGATRLELTEVARSPHDEDRPALWRVRLLDDSGAVLAEAMFKEAMLEEAAP